MSGLQSKELFQREYLPPYTFRDKRIGNKKGGKEYKQAGGLVFKNSVNHA
jgi:hypothetical protein